jgi:multicomponent Na+:H+ antiporter subunit C
VPQALVLTAIVIGFGVISFLLAMAYRSWTIDGNDEVEDDIADRRIAEEAETATEFGEPT